jgi:hypothetical protein
MSSSSRSRGFGEIELTFPDVMTAIFGDEYNSNAARIETRARTLFDKYFRECGERQVLLRGCEPLEGMSRDMDALDWVVRKFKQDVEGRIGTLIIGRVATCEERLNYVERLAMNYRAGMHGPDRNAMVPLERLCEAAAEMKYTYFPPIVRVPNRTNDGSHLYRLQTACIYTATAITSHRGGSLINGTYGHHFTDFEPMSGPAGTDTSVTILHGGKTNREGRMLYTSTVAHTIPILNDY